MLKTPVSVLVLVSAKKVRLIREALLDSVVFYARFLNKSAIAQYYSQWTSPYKGPVPLGHPEDLNSTHLISEQGCRTLCGTGADTYPWETAANTITTWVLPIIGLIIQAPFESNQFLGTFLAACRWVGAPISSLSYIFWNINITGKCAIMVDMAIEYNMFPDALSVFSQIRDSFYILSVMSQYSLNPQIDGVSAERILRVALFDNDLTLLNPNKGLIQRRAKLAGSLRSGRKRGVVPAFISTLWFLLSLVISLQIAFSNPTIATADYLAIGLLLSWLPVLTLSGITDRSPCSADEIQDKLNHFLNLVQLALLRDPSRRCGDIPIPKGGYFTKFCGQARSRWHIGVAHRILVGIESDFATHHGRGWLSHSGARDMLISRRGGNSGTIWFEFPELWQVISAIGVVGSSTFGSFIIAYFTRTVGLGCRSGGYLIFFTLAFTDFAAESIVWWAFPAESPTRKKLGYLLNLIEIVNTGWLVYILGAQTFGLYQTCSCLAGSWGGGGGYINLRAAAGVSNEDIRLVYWSTGTILSCTAMFSGFLYIVVEWCTQSYMWTVDYDDAMAGLKSTRRFKKYTSWFRCVPDWVIVKLKTHRPKFLGERRGRRSLVWKWEARK